MRKKVSKVEIASVCQIRLNTGLPCDRCEYSDKCKAYQKQKGKVENEQKIRKQRSKGSKAGSSKNLHTGSQEG